MKILIVDDYPTMRKIVREQLRKLEFTSFVEAEDGTDAFKILKNEKIDFIVSDWNMPNMSGIELIHKIKQEDNLKDIPILLITAEAQKDQIVEAAKAGVNGYIVKPFNTNTLNQKIQKIFH